MNRCVLMCTVVCTIAALTPVLHVGMISNETVLKQSVGVSVTQCQQECKRHGYSCTGNGFLSICLANLVKLCIVCP